MSPNSSIGIYFHAGTVYLVSVKGSAEEVLIGGCLAIVVPKGGGDEEFYGRLKGFREEHGAAGRTVYIGFSRQDAILLSLELPSPTEENLREVLGYELDRHTPYTKEDAYIDFRVVGRNEESKSIRVLVLVASKSKVEQCLELVRGAGFHLAGVEIGSSATCRAVMYKRNIGVGRYVVVDIGKVASEVILVEDGLPCYSRAFDSEPTDRAGGIAKEVSKGLKQRGWSCESVKETVLRGGAKEELPELGVGLEAQLCIKTAVLEEFPVGAHGEVLDSGYIAAFGMALRGLDSQPQCPPFNLMPGVQKHKPKKKELLALLSVVVLTVILGVAVLLSPSVKRQQMLSDVVAEMDLLRPNVSEVEEVRAKGIALNKKLEQLSSVMLGEPKAMNILREVTRVLPSGTWLTDLKYKREGVEISGFSTSASSLIALLEDSSYFSGVQFSAPVTVTNSQPVSGTHAGQRSNHLVNGMAGPKPSGKQVDKFRIKALLEASQ